MGNGGGPGIIDSIIVVHRESARSRSQSRSVDGGSVREYLRPSGVVELVRELRQILGCVGVASAEESEDRGRHRRPTPIGRRVRALGHARANLPARYTAQPFSKTVQKIR